MRKFDDLEVQREYKRRYRAEIKAGTRVANRPRSPVKEFTASYPRSQTEKAIDAAFAAWPVLGGRRAIARLGVRNNIRWAIRA